MKKTVQPAILSDEQLIDLYTHGNQSILGDLYNRYFDKVYRRCYSFTKNNSEAFDLAQDILIKSFGKLNTFKGNSRFSTWLFAITNNYCIEVLRKNKNFAFEIIDDQIVYLENNEEDFSDISELFLNELINLLKEIPEVDQAMLRMKYEHNYSIKDIQDSFNLSASAVKMRLQRARNKIEKIWLSRYKASA